MGNRSSNPEARGDRTLVHLPGFHVKGLICIPRCQSHGLWLLGWVEQLLAGRSLEDVTARPPWPSPGDPLVSRQLVRELIDLRWVVPDWSGTAVKVADHLAVAHAREGRVGLARALFDADVLPGEWWMDAFGGALLSRQASAQFDWDLKRRADIRLEPPSDPRALVDAYEPDLADLVAKLGAAQRVWEARDRAFLAAPLVAGTRKDILFTLYGRDLRVLPDELAELEPVLAFHAPRLLGANKTVRSRVVRLPSSPIEGLAREIERLPSDPATLGPIAPVRERVSRIAELVAASEGELEAWLEWGCSVRPVVGSTQRQFDALAEICAAVGTGDEGWILLTSAFLNEQNVALPDGLVAALEEAPSKTRFLLIYGHANDDLPAEQQAHVQRWLEVVREKSQSVAERMIVVVGKRRSHEKVVVTSAGDWMIGSWNPASSLPNATVFECSVTGRNLELARSIVDRVAKNVEGHEATSAVAVLAGQLVVLPQAPNAAEQRRESISTLRRAVRLLASATQAEEGPTASAWTACVRAVRAAWHPFLTTSRVELVDEQQTRDAFVAHVRSAKRNVLIASDRLGDGGLDQATLRDLRGDGRSRPLVRVVWGREWAGRRVQEQSREPIRRAQDAIGEAWELLGDALCTSDEPMENHAKVLLVDGLRGVVTSENFLSYGGEKGRYESRELGVIFSSPVLARHLLGRFLHHWPAELASVEPRPAEPSLALIVAANEAWHALSRIGEQLEFDWQTPAYVGAIVRNEIEATKDVHARALADIERVVGSDPFPWLREEAERLGLTRVADGWLPYDVPAVTNPADLVATAERHLVATQSTREGATTNATARPANPIDPLVARVLDCMVRIPAGRFRMGDDRVPLEQPRHEVVISRPFLMSRTPVTQWLWGELMGSTPFLRDVERHPEFPIIQIGYEDIRHFLKTLNAKAGRLRFELPTEAQWEYACRGGSEATYCFGDDPGTGDRPGLLERYAWTKRNAGGRLQQVGALEPNAWGLYDVHGLVYETMRDGFRTYTHREAIDPVGPLDGRKVVARGGSWGRFPLDRRRENEHFRCASRQVHEKSHRVSFRIVCTIEGET